MHSNAHQQRRILLDTFYGLQIIFKLLSVLHGVHR
jgi:hypothetical protein